MFSRRLGTSHDANALSAALADRRRAGLPILDLTETNPTRVDLPLPSEAIREALDSPRILTYAPEPFGLREAREAVAATFDHRVGADRIVLTSSTSEAYSWLFKLLCDPGDRVLVPTPSYPLFDQLAALEGVEVDTYPAWFSDGWHLDVDALAHAIRPETRALLVVSPNNPTGAVLRRGEVERLEALCSERGLALLCDEVFSDFVTSRDPGLVRSVAGRDRCLTFALGGLSKSCLLPQLKLAWTAVSGPDALVRDALARLDLIADVFLPGSAPVQLALPKLLALGPELRKPLQERLARNRQALGQALASSPVSLLPSDGGWTAVLRGPRERSDEAWALALLQERGVVVHPGHFYDLPADGHLVVSLLPPPETFDAAVRFLSASSR